MSSTDAPPSYDKAIVSNPDARTTNGGSNGNGNGADLTRSTSASSEGGGDPFEGLSEEERRELADEYRELPEGWVKCWDPKCVPSPTLQQMLIPVVGTNIHSMWKKRQRGQFGPIHTMIPNTFNPYPIHTPPTQTRKQHKRGGNKFEKHPFHPPSVGRKVVVAVAIMAKVISPPLMKMRLDLECQVELP